MQFIFLERSAYRTRFLILIIIIIFLMLIGTLFYCTVEGWSAIDALYFSAISLTTRGYGELHPTHGISKLFTVFYLFLGVAFILYALSNFIGYYIQHKEPEIQKKMESLMNRVSPPKKEKWLVIKNPKHSERPFPFEKR